MWAENWPALNVFLTLSTQWRLAPSGHLVGLDYTAIPPALGMLGVARREWPELFEDLRVMERAAIEALQPAG